MVSASGGDLLERGRSFGGGNRYLPGLMIITWAIS